MLLDELVARLTQLPEKSRSEAIDLAVKSTATMAWVPNPGPQTQAFLCEADELFYGGEAGGGKTDLGIGLALTEHKRSLLLRRINKDALKIKPRIEEILGHDNGYNGQLQRWRLGDRQIDIAGCEQESDKQRFKGDPHDLIGFDKGTDFLEFQYRFIIGWNRSTDPKQRCRVIVASNPPTTPEGVWVVKYWGPWLDTTHPNPAKRDGSAITLPPDPELRADFCAPTWKLGARGILLESKNGSSGFGNLRQRLGRSPGKGDAVVMAWSEGNAAAVSRQNARKWERKERQRWIV